ncbi:hypothetical protein [Chroococcidiopsis sp [FACHB-1243]]|nr:hypothetical protein [Chroococcidiopsis sp. [FACHB-1243]]
MHLTIERISSPDRGAIAKPTMMQFKPNSIDTAIFNWIRYIDL